MCMISYITHWEPSCMTHDLKIEYHAVEKRKKLFYIGEYAIHICPPPVRNSEHSPKTH